MGFWRVISKFFSTPTTVFVGVFVLLCFFLVIYYLVGACKGLRRGLASFVFINILIFLFMN